MSRPCRAAKLLSKFAFVLLLTTAVVRGSILFDDNFLSGWTVVQPPGEYFAGPLRWDYDLTNAAFSEQSNIYTDDALNSPSAIAPMLINDTVTSGSFTYTARLTAGDDDGFGLIFGYQDEGNFYRVIFSRQATAGRALGFPWIGTTVDRRTNGAISYVYGPSAGFTNTANRPFDVTVAVDALNRLTLTVVDNPTGTATTYNLMTSQSLPSPASGKVGVFTWGMSGGAPVGFRIQNLNLSPLALTGNLNSATNWTALIPPRAAGNSTTQNGAPNWGIVARDIGASGMMEERGDCFQGNDAAGKVDFTGPTLVAGSDTWSNYVVAARITPFDDDATGIVLRYRNPSNFYRVVLRSQVSTTGPQPGLSIQKNVNQVYSEVYHDSTVSYDPVSGVPYDIVAQIQTNTLNVLLVADPDGASRVFRYGPFNITGANTGKIGLVSWAMARADFDWISVQDGASLYVSSAFGSANPPRGLASYAPGALINASVGPATVSPGTRRTATGWLGAGSVPPSGTGTNVSFTLDRFSELHWQWQTEYQLSVTNGPGGSVTYPPGDWFLEGSGVTVTANPNPGYAFAGWTGDSVATSAQLNLVMDHPYSITATFVLDSDADGLPDNWETAWFGNLSANPTDDPDGDGQGNAREQAAGTNPLFADILRIEKLQLTNNAGLLTVSNNTGTRYNVQRTITLPSNWATIATLQTSNTYASTLPSPTNGFWRLSQPARPVDVPPFVPGSWTLVALPDTQIYSQSYPELFKDQTRWIVANKDRYNIKYVLHLGDIVNIPMDLVQWTNAKAAISILDGQVPYALATGNHDHGTSSVGSDRATVVNNYFPVSNYTNWPTFGGTWQPNRIENSYHLFSAGGVDWIIFALEWGPRNSPITWANQVLTNYPNRKAILITHAYTYYDDTRYDWASKGSSQQWNPHSYGTASDPDGTNDGEELWNKLVKVSPNFVIVLNGHVLNDGLGRLSSTNNFGGVVHQMLVNYQMKSIGGEAFLRLVEFHPDGKTVQVKAYSPYYGTYKTDPENQFTLTLEPPLH
jgi:uncharacterized repeat protein (TIGR02543 family)